MVKIRKKGTNKIIEVPFESYKADYERFGFELVKDEKDRNIKNNHETSFNIKNINQDEHRQRKTIK